MTPDAARAIARAVMTSGAGSQPRPFTDLLAGQQAVIRAEAAVLGLDPEALYAQQVADLAARQAEQRAEAEQARAIDAYARGTRP